MGYLPTVSFRSALKALAGNLRGAIKSRERPGLLYHAWKFSDRHTLAELRRALPQIERSTGRILELHEPRIVGGFLTEVGVYIKLPHQTQTCDRKR